MTKAHLSAIVAILSLGSSPVVAQKKAGNASQGKVVFGRCSGCHSADTPDRKGGPSLKGLFKRSKLETTGKPPTVTNVLKIINEGRQAMPPYKNTLNDTERADLVAYLRTL
jgi:mono/diheme cytochrome c family protein